MQVRLPKHFFPTTHIDELAKKTIFQAIMSRHFNGERLRERVNYYTCILLA